MCAAKKGQTEAVKIRLEYEKKMRDSQNHSALYHALNNGHIKLAEIVMPHEDPTDENGVTALMRAADRGDVEAVRLLIPLQKEIKDKYGNTAFVYAHKSKHVDTATVLRDHEAPSWTPLMCAAFTGDIEIAKKHLSAEDIAEFSDIFKTTSISVALGIQLIRGSGRIVSLYTHNVSLRKKRLAEFV